MTPGPWTWERCGGTDEEGRPLSPVDYLISAPDPKFVTVTFNEADARLIAAAPDLLAALGAADDLLRRLDEWDVMSVTGDGPYWKREIAKVREPARAAIAKAEGES